MDIRSIRNYIVEKHPDSCLSYNDRNNIMCDEELLQECEDFFYFEMLGWCGCGTPDVAKKVIRDFLRLHKRVALPDGLNFTIQDYEQRQALFNQRFGVKNVYDNELLLCLAYALDAAGFTDHGSSIGGAWLSEEGEMFLWLLEQNEELNEEE